MQVIAIAAHAPTGTIPDSLTAPNKNSPVLHTAQSRMATWTAMAAQGSREAERSGWAICWTQATHSRPREGQVYEARMMSVTRAGDGRMGHAPHARMTMRQLQRETGAYRQSQYAGRTTDEAMAKMTVIVRKPYESITHGKTTTAIDPTIDGPLGRASHSSARTAH